MNDQRLASLEAHVRDQHIAYQRDTAELKKYHRRAPGHIVPSDTTREQRDAAVQYAAKHGTDFKQALTKVQEPPPRPLPF